jgi:hypothetical protein
MMMSLSTPMNISDNCTCMIKRVYFHAIHCQMPFYLNIWIKFNFMYIISQSSNYNLNKSDST